MQTLSNCYHEISENTNDWSYYPNCGIFIDKAWESEEAAYSFIKEYFDYAGKSEVFRDSFLLAHESSIKERAPHIISTYLLGIKIANCFHLDIFKRDQYNMNLAYYWFLACLYHDVGYALENNFECKTLCSISEKGIEGFRRKYNIKHIRKKEFQTYPKEIINFYFSCRANCQIDKPVIDHGIAGGLLLYDKLLRNYINAWKSEYRIGNTENDFRIMHSNGRVLRFSKTHQNAYAIATDAIIMHNVWKRTLRKYLYRYPSLNELPKIDLAKRISVNDKLCFLLCLADTLEPIKHVRDDRIDVSGNPDLRYLEQIQIGSMKNLEGFELQMPMSTYDVFRDDITGLEDWIAVKVMESTIPTGIVRVRITDDITNFSL